MNDFLSPILTMKYVMTGISSGQMLRYTAAIDDCLELLPETAYVTKYPVKSELHDHADLGEDIILNSIFSEILYQEVLGFRMNLVVIEHKGLLKTFKSYETGEILKVVVLIPAEICEN